MITYAIYVYKKDSQDEEYDLLYETPVPLQRGDKLRFKTIGESGSETNPLREDVVRIKDIGQEAGRVGELNNSAGTPRELYRSNHLHAYAEIERSDLI